MRASSVSGGSARWQRSHSARISSTGPSSQALGRILKGVTMSADIAFEDVPQPSPEAVVDPNWLQLRGDSLLPTLYMPPTMAGRRPTWMRAIAVVLIGIFLLATVLGLCLTYGPPSAGW